MALQVFVGDKTFSKPDEGAFLFQMAFSLKHLFAEQNFDGILLLAPRAKGFSSYKPDAILFSTNAIIVIEVKSHGGKIITPSTELGYRKEPWYHIPPDKNHREILKGGNHGNPYNQVQDYKNTLRQVLSDISAIKSDTYINTGVIIYGDNLDFNQVKVPKKFASNFFVANGDIKSEHSYYYHIYSILNDEPRERSANLSTNDLKSIREHFIVKNIEITEDELFKKISKLQGAISKDKLRHEIDEATKKAAAQIRTLTVKNASLEKDVALLATRNMQLHQEKAALDKERQETLKKYGEHSQQVTQIDAKIERNNRQAERIEQEMREIKNQLTELSENQPTPSIKKSPWTIIISIIAVVLIAIGASIIAAFIIKTQSNPENSIVSPTRPQNLAGPYKAYVQDGDSISVYIDNQKTAIRLIGISAPEVKTDHTENQCYGPQAKSFLIDKIGGKEIYLEKDDSQGDKDKYDRLLRYVWYQDTLINLELIQQGYAKETTFGNPYLYRELFTAAQTEARNDNRGLWGSCQ